MLDTKKQYLKKEISLIKIIKKKNIYIIYRIYLFKKIFK